jgi:hypothetical protein
MVKFKGVVVLVIVCSVGLLFYYWLFKEAYGGSNTKEKPTTKAGCVQLVYLNTRNQEMDTAVTNAVIFDVDSIVSFKSPSGKIWKGKDIVEQKQVSTRLTKKIIQILLYRMENISRYPF